MTDQRIPAKDDDADVIEQSALDRLEALGGGAFVVEMLDLFNQQVPSELANVDSAVATGDLEALERAAHSIKSSAANLGAALLRQRAAQTESLARRGDRKAAIECALSLSDAFTRTRAAFQNRRRRYTER